MAHFSPRLAVLVVVVTVSMVATPAAAGPTGLPPGFKTCKRGDIPCIENAIMDAFHRLGPGIPEYGLPPLDPLKLAGLEIGDSKSSSPVNLHIKFNNIVVHGLQNAKPTGSTLDLNKMKLFARGEMEEVVADADYEMNGRILLLPAQGKGKTVFKLSNVVANVTMLGEREAKKGKDYLKVTDFTFRFVKVDNMHMKFENLFNGDKALGEPINNLVNENWPELWSQVQPGLEQVFDHHFKEYSKRIFDKTPIDEIFLPN